MSIDSVPASGLDAYINLSHINYSNTFTGVTDDNGTFVAFDADNLSEYLNSDIILGEITIDYGILSTLETH